MQHNRKMLRTAAAFVAALYMTFGSANAQTPAYDVASLNGSYAYTLTGRAVDPINRRDTLIAEAGRLTADGAGNVSGADTVTISGDLVRRTFTGTYTINPDGTGALVLYPTFGPQIHADIVVGQRGHVGKLVITDSGNTLSGVIEGQQVGAQIAPGNGYDASALNGGYEYKIDGYAVDLFGNLTPISEIGPRARAHIAIRRTVSSGGPRGA